MKHRIIVLLTAFMLLSCLILTADAKQVYANNHEDKSITLDLKPSASKVIKASVMSREAITKTNEITSPMTGDSSESKLWFYVSMATLFVIIGCIIGIKYFNK